MCVVWLCNSTHNDAHDTCPRERRPGARPAGAPRKAEVPARRQCLVPWFIVYVFRGRRQARNAAGKLSPLLTPLAPTPFPRRKIPSHTAQARTHTHAQRQNKHAEERGVHQQLRTGNAAQQKPHGRPHIEQGPRRSPGLITTGSWCTTEKKACPAW